MEQTPRKHPRRRRIVTRAHFSVDPPAAMTGSFISSLVMGHRNSSGGPDPLSSAFRASIFLMRRLRSPNDSERQTHSCW